MKQEKRRAAVAEADLKEVGLEFKKPLSPILGHTSPLLLPSGSSLGNVGCAPAAALLSSSRPASSSASIGEGYYDGRGDPRLFTLVREVREQSLGDTVAMRAAQKSGWCMYTSLV